jgi:hypothetical protein
VIQNGQNTRIDLLYQVVHADGKHHAVNEFNNNLDLAYFRPILMLLVLPEQQPLLLLDVPLSR